MKTVARGLLSIAVCCVCVSGVSALDPNKELTQFTRTIWTQQDGLPQDTINAIAQTTDGYLWLATDEGLARFDGYDFTVFNQAKGNLPSNAVTALAAEPDGSLWIGTANGLAHYSNRKFRFYTTKDGLPDNSINSLYVNREGVLWIVAGAALSRFDGDKISAFAAATDLPFTVRTVLEDRHQILWVAGFTGLAQWAGGKFISKIDASTLGGNLITELLEDEHDNLWMAGSQGIVRRSPNGEIRRFGTSDGLPNMFVRSLILDHNRTLWAGTTSGLARFSNDRFVGLSGPAGRDPEFLLSLYEDQEGDLWVGANDGLIRFRDDVITVYGKNEGLPGDDPNTLYQDHRGRIWVGFHSSGLMLFSQTGNKLFSTRDGLPSNEIFSIAESREGDLLLNTRGGFVRMRDGKFKVYVPPDELGRRLVLASLEDSSGTLWLGLQRGLGKLRPDGLNIIFPGGPLFVNAVIVLCEGRDGALWAGTAGRGLWRVQGDSKTHYTMNNGLSSDRIRSLSEDRDGTLWIATFGGGLNAFRDGRFMHFTAKDGLLSDNISHVTDDGESLWLSTTRGICRISKQQLNDLSEHKIQTLQPTNYGVEDGLRSAQSSPAFTVAGGGTRTSDGRLWFPTIRGLAVIDPSALPQPGRVPTLHLLGINVDGKDVDLSQTPKLKPGSDRIRIRFTAIHLSAPERVQYFHKLEGLDQDWVSAGRGREINYNSLRPGKYRFVVRAALPDGAVAEQAYGFEKSPRFYESGSFQMLCAFALLSGGWGLYQLRLRRLRYWFALVLAERARLAREIHDTLAQGFIGISSQLDAVAMTLPEESDPARQHLELARKMARHSITEARRSVVDLRASVLEGRNLGAALHAGAMLWTSGSGVVAEVDVSVAQEAIPDEFEQHLLRIAQEAVINVVKHAEANTVYVKMRIENRKLYLQIADNGRGFEHRDVFSSDDGHFGLIGMRERAERIGGELHLASQPGQGTQVEVMVVLP